MEQCALLLPICFGCDAGKEEKKHRFLYIFIYIEPRTLSSFGFAFCTDCEQLCRTTFYIMEYICIMYIDIRCCVLCWSMHNFFAGIFTIFSLDEFHLSQADGPTSHVHAIVRTVFFLNKISFIK